jgi:hypothetical protein
MLSELKKKQAEAKKLTDKLDKALALEYLWPEAFEHGRARSHWYGAAGTSCMGFKRPGEPLHLKHKFTITDGEGNARLFSYDEVPKILGGGLDKDDELPKVTKP